MFVEVVSLSKVFKNKATLNYMTGRPGVRAPDPTNQVNRNYVAEPKLLIFESKL